LKGKVFFQFIYLKSGVFKRKDNYLREAW